ncbi:S-layer homology domain-containing protein [Paenibacillus phytorum]|nr:S-layer homology domain-containing protein [Paenibacillus phytorum]
MIKKIHAFSLMFLLSMLLLSPLGIQASSGPTFLLSISDDSISEEGKFQVTVSGNQVSDLYAYEVKLSFDTNHLECISGSSGKNGYAVGPIVEGNKVLIANSLTGNAPGKNGNVTLATLTFKAKSQGSAEIALDSVKLVNSQLVSNDVSGNSKVSANITKKGMDHTNKKDVFNNDIVSVKDLIQAIQSKVEEAKTSNTKVELADIKGHWAEKTVGTFVKLRIIDGYEDGSFHPDGKITRAEFAAIIARVFDISSRPNHSVILNDLDNHWARVVIEKLASSGVIAGYEDGTFKPDQTISREEMVVILSRVINLSNLDKDASKGNLTDLASASSYAVNQIKDAAEAGLISGKNDGIFDPHGNSTRAEALTVILNALNLDPQLKSLLDSLD